MLIISIGESDREAAQSNILPYLAKVDRGELDFSIRFKHVYIPEICIVDDNNSIQFGFYIYRENIFKDWACPLFRALNIVKQDLIDKKYHRLMNVEELASFNVLEDVLINMDEVAFKIGDFNYGLYSNIPGYNIILDLVFAISRAFKRGQSRSVVDVHDRTIKMRESPESPDLSAFESALLQDIRMRFIEMAIDFIFKQGVYVE